MTWSALVQPCVAVGQDNPVVETVIDLDDWRVVVDCVGDAQEHVGLVEVEPARSDELAVDIEDDRFDRHRDDAVVDVRDLVVVGVLHKLRGDLDVVVGAHQLPRCRPTSTESQRRSASAPTGNRMRREREKRSPPSRNAVITSTSSPYGIRTRAATLRGWCPRPLDERAKWRSPTISAGGSGPTGRRAEINQG